MLISTLHLINRQRIDGVHHTRESVHTRLMQMRYSAASVKSPLYLCAPVTPMSQQSLQNWVVHVWLRQPRPWTHTRQETGRKVSIQLLGPLSLSHSAELIMYLQYAPLCVCVCACTWLCYHTSHSSESWTCLWGINPPREQQSDRESPLSTL